jgi:putative transposase
MWLLVGQRLDAGGSMDAALLKFLQDLPADYWPDPCKRVREWMQDGKAPSSNTAGYSKARLQLPVAMVEKSCDHIFEKLSQMSSSESMGGRRAFLVDGSSMRMPHNAALRKRYPPASNQHGEAHWPILRILVAHDLHTGLALRPEWGAMYGSEAVSEQELLGRAIERLPSGSTIVGDANFGVFSVAYTAAQRSHPVLLRLTKQRAQHLAGEPLRDGIDRTLVWKPSANDRRAHPELPADAGVEGRLIIREVQPEDKKPFLLAIFTTLSDPVEEAVALYGTRWSIETDLRTLKSQLRLNRLTCTTPEMVAKEIDMGITAYNLVRGMMLLASQQSGIPPRGYRFAKVSKILEVFGPALAKAPNEETATRIFNQMMQYIQQAKVYRRRPRPSYPRAVWKTRDSFPRRKK